MGRGCMWGGGGEEGCFGGFGLNMGSGYWFGMFGLKVLYLMLEAYNQSVLFVELS